MKRPDEGGRGFMPTQRSVRPQPSGKSCALSSRSQVCITGPLYNIEFKVERLRAFLFVFRDSLVMKPSVKRVRR